MPSFETGIPRACAKSGPSGSTIAKSSVAMNRAVPIRNTSLRSEIRVRISWRAWCGVARRRTSAAAQLSVGDLDRLEDRLYRVGDDLGVWVPDDDVAVAHV